MVFAEAKSWDKHESDIFPHFQTIWYLQPLAATHCSDSRFLHGLCLCTALASSVFNKSQSWIKNCCSAQKGSLSTCCVLDQKAFNQPPLKKKNPKCFWFLDQQILFQFCFSKTDTVLLLIGKINAKPSVVLIWDQCNFTLNIFVILLTESSFSDVNLEHGEQLAFSPYTSALVLPTSLESYRTFRL